MQDGAKSCGAAQNLPASMTCVSAPVESVEWRQTCAGNGFSRTWLHQARSLDRLEEERFVSIAPARTQSGCGAGQNTTINTENKYFVMVETQQNNPQQYIYMILSRERVQPGPFPSSKLNRILILFTNEKNPRSCDCCNEFRTQA